jgi:hypothetical protein
MTERFRAAALSLLLVWAAASCDSSPSGPGSLPVTVEARGAPLGAVTLEVVGAGVRGFEGVGNTHAFGGVVSARQNRHRVVLVDPVGGVLRLAIRVEDVRAEPPRVTVVSAAGTDNLARAVTDVEARVVLP